MGASSLLLSFLLLGAADAAEPASENLPKCVRLPSFAWCSGDVKDTGKPLPERRAILRYLGEVKDERREKAREVLGWLAFSPPEELRPDVLNALVASGVLRRKDVPRVPTGDDLIDALSRLLQPPEGHASNTTYSDVDCVPVKDGTEAEGVYCSERELEGFEPRSCRLVGGSPLKVSCRTTRCGSACMVWYLRIEASLVGSKWKAKAFLDPQGDTGECGCCDLFE